MKGDSVGTIKLVIMFVVMQLTACGLNNDGDRADSVIETPWWKLVSPDLVIKDNKFYVRNCSFYKMKKGVNDQDPELVFSPPYRLATSCSGSELNHDGEFYIISMCRITFGAGGCGSEQYRSSDLENWQEYIGITWRNSEEYEAWRVLGSTSNKADAIKKVEK